MQCAPGLVSLGSAKDSVKLIFTRRLDVCLADIISSDIYARVVHDAYRFRTNVSSYNVHVSFKTPENGK